MLYKRTVLGIEKITTTLIASYHYYHYIFSGSQQTAASDSVIFECGFSFYSETLHYWPYHPVDVIRQPSYQHKKTIYSPLRIVVCKCVQFMCIRKCTFEIKQIICYIRHFNLIVILSIGLRKGILMLRFSMVLIK